jgi:hypothetical protein
VGYVVGSVGFVVVVVVFVCKEPLIVEKAVAASSERNEKETCQTA